VSTSPPIIILGVDPGTLVTGYGVIEATGRGARVIEYDVIKNRSESSMPLRLKSIFAVLSDVIDRLHPDEFAIETAFYGKNAQSALKLGHARGVSILAAVSREIPTSEYSPREVKKAVVGNGGASKEQVQAMVQTLLRLKETGFRYRMPQFLLEDPEPMLYYGEIIYRDGKPVGNIMAGGYGHTLGASVGVGPVENEGGTVSVDYIKSGTYEIDIAGVRYPAKVSLRPMYDLKLERVRC